MRPFLLFALAAALAGGEARTFHLAPDGDDRRDGLTAQTAWRTPAGLAQAPLNAGDRVEFAAGEYRGALAIDQRCQGTAERPIVIVGAGRGKTVIVSPDATAIALRDQGGFEIRDLTLRGDAAAAKKGHAGISAFSHDANGRRSAHLVIEDVEVSGFGSDGISIGSWHPSYPGWDDVRIARCDVSRNLGGGIVTYDFTGQKDTQYGIRRLTIEDCVADDNAGGTGIVLGGVDGGVVRGCRAVGNHGAGGNVGMWAYSAHAVVFDRCLVMGTRTRGKDGGGFDLDGGCSDCVVQRCLTCDNDGIGYMHCDFPASRPTRRNVIRFCASVDDGRKREGGVGFGFVTWGNGLDDCVIHSCTAWAGYQELGENALLLACYLPGFGKDGDVQHLRGCVARGNVVVARTPGAVLVEDELPEPSPDQVRFVDNRYAGEGASFVHVPAGDRARLRRWADLAAWRGALGQERERDADTGGEGDAALTPPTAERPTDAAAIAALPWLRRASGSPLDAAARIARAALPSLPSDLTDLFGQPLPADGLYPGADQRR